MFCWSTGGRYNGLAVSAFCGSVDFFKYLLDKGNPDLRGESSLDIELVAHCIVMLCSNVSVS